MSDREEAFLELARRYEQATGVKVKFQLFAPSEAYAQRVKASAQTNTLPDLYGVLGEKRDFASFIRSGYVMDLAPFLNEAEGVWKHSFFERALSVNEFVPGNEYGVAPGIYGIPLDVSTIQMLYNKRLLAEAGGDPDNPPRTWEEFLRVCDAMKERGIPRFVSGFGEIWMIEALATNWAMNLMGEDKVFRTYRGEVPYTDADWVKIFEMFGRAAKDQVLVEGAVTMVNKTAEQTFANERAAFSFNGSWCVNVYKGMNPNLSYGAFLPPAVSPGNPMRIWGGAGSSFLVNNQSERRLAAVEFLKWLTAEPQQTFLAQETENLPAVRSSLAGVSPILAQFADDMDNALHPNMYPIHEIPSVMEAFCKGIQFVLIGEKKPAEVAAEVQRLKEKEMKKIRP